MDKTVKCNKTCFFYHEDTGNNFGGGYPPMCEFIAKVANKATDPFLHDTNKKVDCLAYLDYEMVFDSAVNVALAKAKTLSAKEKNNGGSK